MIYLTSFFKAHDLPDGVMPYSAAVYQPKGFALEKAGWTDIRDPAGGWIRPREFVGADVPLYYYRQALMDLYRDREGEVRRWLDVREGISIALLCWCPYDKAAQRQLKEHGSFVCHTAVLGEFLIDLGQKVWYDSDRSRMAVLPR